MPSGSTNVSVAFGVYLEAQEAAEKLHGDRTIVYMQMGSFLEMFHVKFEDGSELGKANEISDVLNKMGDKTDQVGKMFKGRIISQVSRYGFPFKNESKEKYISVATKRGYTVPVYYQQGNEKDPITKVVPRKLGDTWTPTIQPDMEGQNEWFVGYLLLAKNASVCAINPRTRSFAHHSLPEPMLGIIPESIDFLRTHPPSEVMVWTETDDSDIAIFGIPEEATVRRATIGRTSVDSDLRDTVMGLFNEVYVLPSDIPEVVVRSFDFLMCTIPDVMVDTHYNLQEKDDANSMRLENHCLLQLNILEDPSNKFVKKRNRSVIGVVNHTQTQMGNRTIKQWITTPSTNYETVTKRAGLGRHFASCSNFEDWVKCLKGMADLDRLFSSEVLGGLSYTLLQHCKDTIYRFIEQDKHTPIYSDSHKYNTFSSEGMRFVEEVNESLLPMDSLPMNGSTVGGSGLTSYSDPVEVEFPFSQLACERMGVGGEEVVWETYLTYTSMMKNLRALENLTETDLGFVNGQYVFWVKGGKKAVVQKNGLIWENAKKIDSPNQKGRYELCTETRVTFNGRKCVLKDYLKKVISVRNEIERLTRKLWLKWSKDMRKKHEKTIMSMSYAIGEVDAAMSGVKCIHKYAYSYPTIFDVSDGNESESKGASWYKVEGLRHPLIESIQQDHLYIPHNISMTSKDRGRLLFGVNSSGKSSLMKAVGISVILAQAGLPVPALKMEIGLYRSLFTRILGNDNLFQGMSTFAVEASELIRIVRHSNERSLVLGDELCSGTEQYGAEAIVASSILTLLKRDVSFVFATHWHRLRDLPELRAHPRLRWNHLRVDCTEDGKMVMYRTLEDGPGPRGYAIEFIANMGGDSEMIREAIRIRKMITSEEFAVKSARSWNGGGETTSWNQNVRIQSKCAICKERNVDETDHIVPRENANESGGVIGMGSVHHGGNLVGLCRDCHRKKTNGEIVIHGYKTIMGSNGIKEKILEWEFVTMKPMVSEASVENVVIEKTDPVKELIMRFSASGSTVRQIQNAMRRNGYKVSQSFIRQTLA